jgi:glycosyltransferase involved in cell wall biosynthesis
MKILMLGRWLPPLRSPVRATREYQFAHHLARRHQLTLAFINDAPDAAGPISTLRSEFGDLEFAAVPRGWKSLASAVRLATGESCTLSYFRSEALRTRLADRLRSMSYDLVFVSASSMIPYALEVDAAIPLVMDFSGLDSEWWVRQAAHGSFGATRFCRTEAVRLRTAETAVARRAVRSIVDTATTAEIVRSLVPDAAVAVIPNGVDVDYFTPARRPGQTPTVVLCTGLVDESEMQDIVDFCRRVGPMLRARVPDSRIVVGSRDVPGRRVVAELAGLKVVASAGDLRMLLHDQAVVVAPRQSAFDLHRSVLEPMAAGMSVVTTPTVRGQLGAVDGRDLRVADGPLDFAVHLSELLRQRSERHRVGDHARKFVQDHFSWQVLASRLGDEVAAAVSPARSAAPPPVSRRIAAALGG